MFSILRTSMDSIHRTNKSYKMTDIKAISVVLLFGVAVICIYQYKENVYDHATTIYSGYFSTLKLGWLQQVYDGSKSNNISTRQKKLSTSRSEVLKEVKDSYILSKEDWMTAMEEKYKKINKNIYDVCQRHKTQNNLTYNAETNYNQSGKLSKQTYRKTWMLDIDHKIAFCKNSKVGTTTWIYHYYQLLTDIEQQDIHKYFELNPDWRSKSHVEWLNFVRNEIIRRSYFHIPFDSILPLNESVERNVSTRKLLNTYFQNNQMLSFSFVRHPFERIVSAYKDKFMRRGKVASRVVQKYNIENNATFPEFIDLVLQQHLERKRCILSRTNKYCDHYIDIHWMPFNHRCLFCDIPYNVIGKAESFNDDVKYVILKQNLEKFIPLNTTVLRLNGKDDKKQEGAKMETLKYFSLLSKLQIDKLYEFYRLDFELFDYDGASYTR